MSDARRSAKRRRANAVVVPIVPVSPAPRRKPVRIEDAIFNERVDEDEKEVDDLDELESASQQSRSSSNRKRVVSTPDSDDAPLLRHPSNRAKSASTNGSARRK